MEDSMRKNTEFGYLYKRLEHLERMSKYQNEKYQRLLNQFTTVFQRLAVLEKDLKSLDSED